MKENLKKVKGITLIALVITIIVLLILAGVSIATLAGDNGILTRSAQAQSEHADATVKEAIELVYSEYQIIINETTGKVIEHETKIASTTQVKIQGKEENYLATPSMSFCDFLKDEKEYIDENGVIDVEKLTGENLNKGNGIGDNDVYKIVQEKGGYVLKYYENSTKQITLWEVETVSDEEIFVYDETEEGIEIVGLDFTKLECEKTETGFGIYASEEHPVSAIKIENMKTLKIPATINGKNVISVNFFSNRSIGNYLGAWVTVIGIEEIVYPETVKIIGSEEYAEPSINLSSVKKIQLPEGLEEIRSGECTYPFVGMTELEEITIPSSVKKISSMGFYGTRHQEKDSNLIVNIKGKDSEADFEESYGGKFLLYSDDSGNAFYATVNYLGK